MAPSVAGLGLRRWRAPRSFLDVRATVAGFSNEPVSVTKTLSRLAHQAVETIGATWRQN
jgi:hypothetical protein